MCQLEFFDLPPPSFTFWRLSRVVIKKDFDNMSSSEGSTSVGTGQPHLQKQDLSKLVSK